jgi:hypothetical protein
MRVHVPLRRGAEDYHANATAAEIYGVKDSGAHYNLNLLRFHCEPNEYSQVRKRPKLAFSSTI